MELKPEDLVITTYRAPWQSRSGWSSVVEAGVSIVHRPTGAMVKVDTEANQWLNRNIAMEMLTIKVNQVLAQKAQFTPNQEEELAAFRAWLEQEMPAGTVIGDPSWWATRIFRQLKPTKAARQPVPAVAVNSDDQNVAQNWIDNAKYLLDSYPNAVRVCKGGGPENLLSSLVLNFIALRDAVAKSQK